LSQIKSLFYNENAKAKIKTPLPIPFLKQLYPLIKLTNYATIDPMSRGILQTKPQIKEFKIVYVVIL
jgi:hypothetical protein